ncbi:hypothetical protein MMC10_011057 [Thelotrema lepadinum]|nr:hypothetical protein [Thelotrema lepadinum]
MHFALPPRKTSQPPPYVRSSRWSPLKAATAIRRQQRTLGLVIFGVILISFFLFLRGTNPSSSVERIPPGSPEVVIVTLLDDSLSKTYVERIKENRENYAARHGYKTFYPTTKDYDIGTSPKTWALIPALRHAQTLFRHSTFFWALSPHAVIMNPTLSLTSHVMEPRKLESLMLKDKPVVPPDSVIHTFSHLKGDKVDLVLTQDKEGLCQESFILRRGDWTNFFLDVWFDPLYRSYNFQKAEGHALEHIVQWHPTILTKLALIPLRKINAYTAEMESRGGKGTTIQDGDFVARAVECEKNANRDCEKEMEAWYLKWKADFGWKEG